MRILHVVPSYIPAYRYGGPIRAVHGLCKALAARGHDVHVFTTNVNGPCDSDVPLGKPIDLDGVKVSYFPSKHLRRLLWAPRMKKAFDEGIREFDLLHIHSIFLWPTWSAARAARHAHVPYIVAPHGMLVKDLIQRKSRFAKTAWINLIEKRNLEAAAAIHVMSLLEIDEIARFGFSLKDVVIVPVGIDMPGRGEESTSPSPLLDHNSTFPHRILRGGAEGGGVGAGGVRLLSPRIKEIIAKGLYLLFLGRVNWKKGLDRLIPALKLIPDIRLIVAGNDEDNYRSKLEKLVSENRLDERVIFCGPVYDADKEALFDNAEAFVLPSYSENFGVAVLEAMASGCPVVVTPEVGLSDTVCESGSGLVVNGDPVALGGSIKNLLLNPDLMHKMGENGKKVVKERFTWEAIALRMESVYKDILMGRTRDNK